MANQRSTDIEVYPKNGSLLIIQPLALAKNPRLKSPADFLAFKKQIFKESLALRFVHVAHLGFDHDQPNNPFFIFEHTCGGVMQFRNHKSGKVSGSLEEFATVITCGNPNCGLRLGLNLSLEQISDCIFQLLLKQMMPELPYANYLDCSQADFYARLHPDAVEEIRSYGLVPVILEFAHTDSTTEAKSIRFNLTLNLGLTFGKGLLTLDSLNEYEEWLRFLKVKDAERKNLLNKQL